ncbi:MAG: NERD domain-containing protein [Gammaproteobacteria bacterium]|nr:NERD domain-containing protein [Gammaproteobacteria bacterium]
MGGARTMIAKRHESSPTRGDARARAGAAAERQMAHYLQRAFAQKADIQVLHNVRLEDRKQPEHDGSPGVCQIDHLILHRWGLFIIESKSVIEEIRVRSDGSGGDEWTRTYAGREVGMASPIQQAAAGTVPAQVSRATPGNVARQGAVGATHARQGRSRDRPARLCVRANSVDRRGFGPGENRTARWVEGTSRASRGLREQG